MLEARSETGDAQDDPYLLESKEAMAEAMSKKIQEA